MATIILGSQWGEYAAVAVQGVAGWWWLVGGDAGLVVS